MAKRRAQKACQSRPITSTGRRWVIFVRSGEICGSSFQKQEICWHLLVMNIMHLMHTMHIVHIVHILPLTCIMPIMLAMDIVNIMHIVQILSVMHLMPIIALKCT